MVAFHLAWKMIRGGWEKLFLPLLGILLSVTVMVSITALGRGGKAVIENNLAYLEGENMTVVSRREGDRRDIQYLETLDFVNYAIPKEPVLRDLDKGMVIYGTTYRSRTAKNLPLNISDNTVMLEKKGAEPYPKEGIVDIGAVRSGIDTRRGIGISLKYGDRESRELLLAALNRFNPQGDYVEAEEGRGVINQIKRNLGKLVAVIIGTATGLGALISISTVASLVRNSRNQIGMLKAVGAKNNLVFQLFFLEGIIISLAGATGGVVLGSLFSILLGKLVGMEPLLRMGDIAGIWILTVTASGILGVIPAKKGAEMSPVEAIRRV